MLNRRNFLGILNQGMAFGAASGISGLTLYPSIVRASEALSKPLSNPLSNSLLERPKKFLIMVRMAEGWDVSLGLDPKAHGTAHGTLGSQSDQQDIFIEYRADEILTYQNLKMGPACAALMPFAPDIAIVNGVFMSDANVSHEANLDYISTGNGSGQAADSVVELAYSTGTGPFGVIFNSRLKRATRNLMPTSYSDLENLRNAVDASQLQDYIAKLKSKGQLRDSQLNLIQNAPARTRLIQAMDGLGAEFGKTIDNSQTGLAQLHRASVLVAAAFSSGVAYQAQLDLSLSLDTHSDHEIKHMNEQKSGWEAVANLFRIFKNIPYLNEKGEAKGSLFDQTTFVVVSEFSRTPALNASKGKDHNPLTNSVLLAGGGVKGGQSFGESRIITRRHSETGESRHVASLVDYATGQVPQTKSEAQSANFQFIFPENIVSTLIEITGADRSRIANINSDVPFLSKIISPG